MPLNRNTLPKTTPSMRRRCGSTRQYNVKKVVLYFFPLRFVALGTAAAFGAFFFRCFGGEDPPSSGGSDSVAFRFRLLVDFDVGALG